jgi:hypothetical protein
MHARWRHFGWAVGCFVGGGLLLGYLGVVGKWVGVALVVFGVVAARAFVLTLRHAPGRIQVGEHDVTLPRGLCRGNDLTLPRDAVHCAFFLRRVVPWTRTGPVLVVETAHGALTYPRDWFASEADQQKIAWALQPRPHAGM